MTQEHWSDWIDHDGSGCPVPVGTVMEVDVIVDHTGDKYTKGQRFTRMCVLTERHAANHAWVWANSGKLVPVNGILMWVAGRVLRYRIRQFSALTDLKALIEQPVEETV